MRRFALVSALLALPCAAGALVVPHSGFVLGANDQPLTGDHAFVFRINDAGGAAVWTSNSCTIAVVAGYYSTTLGGSCVGASAITPDLIPAGATRSLQVTVDSVPLSPAQTIGAAPTASDSARFAGYDLAGLQGVLDARYVAAGNFAKLDPAAAQAGALNVTGSVTAASFAGSGASLTNLNAANVGTGTLGVARGGTGAASLTANAVLVGAGTGAVAPLTSLGTAGQVLTSAGPAAAPTWSTPAVATSGILDANMVRSDGGGGSDSNVVMLSLTVDLTGKEGRWIHIYGGTAISETTNTSNTAIVRVVINNGSDVTVSAMRQGLGAHSQVNWTGDSTAYLAAQGYFKVTAAFAVPNVTIRLKGGIDSGAFRWGDQSSYANFDGEQAGGYLGYAIF